ncbi:MAG: hypothetical protein ACRD4C_04560 [Candidatus Acidiferrales bacterium]
MPTALSNGRRTTPGARWQPALDCGTLDVSKDVPDERLSAIIVLGVAQ